MDKIAVIMCTWRRVNRLDKTFECLLNQTFKNFDFFIWNNNTTETKNIENISSKYKINTNIKHSKSNVGGIGRFYYAFEVCDKYKKIIFIDDDQIFGNNFIEQMVSFYEDKAVVSWWGWKINGNYFNRTRITDLGAADYCGTGGMITDSEIFKNKSLFNIPTAFQFIEDLWLSFVAKYEAGYKLKGCSCNIEIIVDGKDQYTGLKKQKEELYKFFKTKYGI